MSVDSSQQTLSAVEAGPTSGTEPTAPAPHLFVALECHRPLAGATRHRLADVAEVLLMRGETRSWTREPGADGVRLVLRLPDPWMSGEHASLRVENGGFALEDLGFKNGTFLSGERIRRRALTGGELIEVGQTILLFDPRLPAYANDPADLDALARPSVPGLATVVPTLARRFAELARISRSSCPVLIHGASGTGKELLAQMSHSVSGRPGRLMAVNCAALPDSLLEGELFGHRPGAFTGARKPREGLVAAAHRGTLFLDEVSELSPKAQAALLRVLQEHEVTQLGSTIPQLVDLRLVTATNCDLPALVAAERFREDLYARISGYTFELPPLRRRRADIGLILATLLSEDAPAGQEPPRLEVPAGRALLQHPWPRNVRELQQCLHVAATLTDDGLITLEHLTPEVRRATAARALDAADPDLSPEEAERRAEILHLLERHEGNLTHVGEALGRKRQQIQYWCKRYGIDVSVYRRSAARS